MNDLIKERKAAEQAYAETAHNYPEAPVGSRDWCLFWSGWLQACAVLSTQTVPALGWTGNPDADRALILLDHLDDAGDGNAVRIEQLEVLVRKLAAALQQPTCIYPACQHNGCLPECKGQQPSPSDDAMQAQGEKL